MYQGQANRKLSVGQVDPYPYPMCILNYSKLFPIKTKIMYERALVIVSAYQHALRMPQRKVAPKEQKRLHAEKIRRALSRRQHHQQLAIGSLEPGGSGSSFLLSNIPRARFVAR